MSLNPQQTQECKMISIKEVQTILPLSRVTIWKLSALKDENERLPSYKIGTKRLFKLNEVMWWVEKHKADGR